MYIYYILWANFEESINVCAGKSPPKFSKSTRPALGNFSKILMSGKYKKAQGNFFPHALHYIILLPDCQLSISLSIHSIASSTHHVSPILVPFGL